MAEDRDLALLQRDERRQQAEERRLAAAVGAEEGEDFALGNASERSRSPRLAVGWRVGVNGGEWTYCLG